MKTSDKPSDKKPTNLPTNGRAGSDKAKQGRGGWRGSESSLANLERGKGRSQESKEREPVGEPLVDAKQLLDAMRYVLGVAKADGETQLHAECRAWLKENRNGFMTKLVDLDKAVLAQGGQPSPEGPEQPLDESQDRSLQLIDRLLDEWEQENAQSLSGEKS